MSTPMFGVPDHFPIGVNADGCGPEMNPELIVATVCWCDNPGCRLHLLMCQCELRCGENCSGDDLSFDHCSGCDHRRLPKQEWRLPNE